MNLKSLSKCRLFKSPAVWQNHALHLVSFSLFFALADCQGQGTLITFDGQPPGTDVSVQQYLEWPMVFKPINAGDRFGRNGGGGLSLSGYPYNGTAYLQTALGDSLMFSRSDSAVFNLLSADLAEYSTVFSGVPQTVQFIGYRPDGSIVTTDFTTDGIIDGIDLLDDFQTFTFGAEFTGLTRVEVPGYGWSLDNLVVSVPEPGTVELGLLGSALFALRRFTKWFRPSITLIFRAGVR
jgi:hypothetical protein